MAGLVDLGKISKAVVGLADLFGRLAKSIEAAIRSGLTSSDIVRKARERKRLRNFMALSAHLYVHQGIFISAITDFCEMGIEEHGAWERAKFEILTITRMVDQIEQCILPYSDALVARHREEYLELLSGLKERRRLLEFVYSLEYEDALANIPKLRAIGKAYEKLMAQMRDMMIELSNLATDQGLTEKKRRLEPLETTSARSTARSKIKKKKNR